MNKKQLIKHVILTILTIACFIGLMVYSLLPKLSNFRNSVYGFIINVLILTGIITYLCLSKKVNLVLIGKITIAMYGVLYILFGIIDIGIIEALFFLVYAIANIIVFICVYKKTKKAYKSIWIFGVLSYLSTVIISLNAHYINGELIPTFLYPSIIVMVLVFIPCLLYSVTKCKKLENKICIPLIALFGGFAITWLTMTSANVYLDTSKPTLVEYTIIDKDVRTGYRQITTYDLEVKKDNVVFTICVPDEEYYNFEINDNIILSEYKGFFKESYIILDRTK